VFDWVTQHVSGSPLTYLIVFGTAGGDVIFPLIPSETIVITASVIAARGALSISLLVPLVAAGAFVGDNIVYGLGRTVGDPLAEKLFRGDKARSRLDWAERAIRRRGSPLILVGRFVPGGRTASTFAAGTLEMPYRRFARADAAAAALWALYTSMLGYLGGAAVSESLWKPLALSLGIAAAIAVAIEGWRRLQRRQGKDILGDALEQ
jgi:membrane-associated protein